MVYLGLDKALFEIRMNYPGGFRRGISLMKGPGANLVGAGGKKGPEAQCSVSRVDKLRESRLGKPRLFKKETSLLLAVQSCDIRFELAADSDNL